MKRIDDGVGYEKEKQNTYMEPFQMSTVRSLSSSFRSKSIEHTLFAMVKWGLVRKYSLSKTT